MVFMSIVVSSLFVGGKAAVDLECPHHVFSFDDKEAACDSEFLGTVANSELGALPAIRFEDALGGPDREQIVEAFGEVGLEGGMGLDAVGEPELHGADSADPGLDADLVVGGRLGGLDGEFEQPAAALLPAYRQLDHVFHWFEGLVEDY
jgi:hypothetical protein